MDSSNGGRIVIVTRWPVFSVRIVATPFRTCGRPRRTASPRLNPVRLPEVPLCVGTFEAPNSVFAFLLIDAPQGVLAAVLESLRAFSASQWKARPRLRSCGSSRRASRAFWRGTWNRPRTPSLDELKPDVPPSELASRNRLASYQLSHFPDNSVSRNRTRFWRGSRRAPFA